MMRSVSITIAIALFFAVSASALGSDGKSVEQMLTPWYGFSTLADEGSAIVANPASLIELQEFSVGLQTVRPLDESQPTGWSFAYREPDFAGLGAGQLAYESLSEGVHSASRFVYSGAKRAGDTSAVGLGLTYVQSKTGPGQLDHHATWGLDFGFHSVLFDRLTFGAVVHNAYLLGDETARQMLPPMLATGFAVDLGFFRIAGDYLMRGRKAPFVTGVKYGIEGRLGRFVARIGQRSVRRDGAPFTYGGLGYRFDRGSMDLLLRQRERDRSLSLGLSLYF